MFDNKKRLVIQGTAPLLDERKFNPEWEYWGCFDAFEVIESDVYFGIHPNEPRWPNNKEKLLKAQKDSKHMPYKIMVNRIADECAKDGLLHCENYPIEKMLEVFPERYFTNTIAYMLALAIHLGYKDILIARVHMSVTEEYIKERPCTEYFVGMAKGLGIKVENTNDSDLLKAPCLYAFDEEPMHINRIKARETFIEWRLNQIKTLKQNALMQWARNAGRLDVLERINKEGNNPDRNVKSQEELIKQNDNINGQLQEWERALWWNDGVAKQLKDIKQFMNYDPERYLKRLDRYNEFLEDDNKALEKVMAVKVPEVNPEKPVI